MIISTTLNKVPYGFIFPWPYKSYPDDISQNANSRVYAEYQGIKSGIYTPKKNSSVLMYRTSVPIANGPSVMIQIYTGNLIWANIMVVSLLWSGKVRPSKQYAPWCTNSVHLVILVEKSSTLKARKLYAYLLRRLIPHQPLIFLTWDLDESLEIC